MDNWMWIKELLLLLVSVSLASGLQIPEIEGCRYLDGYSVDCWWRRPENDTDTNLRLSYIKASDPLHTQSAHHCSPTLKSVNPAGIIIEHCDIGKVTVFSKFTLFLSVVCNDSSRPCCNETSSSVKFECNLDNVILQAPPTHFHLELLHRKISWQIPNRNESMLGFIVKSREIKYKLVYKQWATGESGHLGEDWKIWYTGPKTSFHLPTLVPGASYETKVYASILPDNVDSSENVNNAWGLPSESIRFKVPVEPGYKGPRISTTIAPQVTFEESTPRNADRKITAAVTTAVLVAAAILLLLIYRFIYKRYCCCRNHVKIPKPVIMVEMNGLRHENVPIVDDGNNEDADPMSVSSLLLHISKHNPGDHSATRPDVNHPQTHHPQSIQRFICEHDRDRGRAHNGHLSLEPDLLLDSDSGEEDLHRSTPCSPAGENCYRNSPFAGHRGCSRSIRNHGGNFGRPISASPIPAAGKISSVPYGMQEMTYDASHALGLGMTSLERGLLKQGSMNDVRGSFIQHSPDIYPAERTRSYTYSHEYDDRSGVGLMEYVMDDTIHAQTSLQGSDEMPLSPEKRREWIKHALMSSPKNTQNVPDYVRHSPGANIRDGVSLFVTLATESFSNFPNSYYCNCPTTVANNVQNLQQKRLTTACPFCKKQIYTCRKITGQEPKPTSEQTRISLDTSQEGDVYHRTSSSDASVDSGYSPDSPVSM